MGGAPSPDRQAAGLQELARVAARSRKFDQLCNKKDYLGALEILGLGKKED
jgi:hypothetical protein